MKRRLYLGPRRFDVTLRRLAEEPEDRLSLRRALDEAIPGGATFRLGDAAVAEQVAARLDSGEMRLQEGPRVPVEGVAAPPVEAEAAPPPKQETRKEAALTWIEIELIGEDDKPIPWEKYRIKLPDGTVRDGALNDQGFARVDGIDPGTCEVTFPALDKAAWVRV